MPEEIVGLIPAAGKGVRLNLPYPKELYPIIRENRYKPIAQFVVENMVASGIGHIVFVVNETKHQLIGYFGSGRRFGCDFSYVVQEDSGRAAEASTSPGLAHALNSAHHLVAGRWVAFGMADTLMAPLDIFARLAVARDAADDVVLGLFRVARPEKLGMVRLGADGIATEIVDKPLVTDLDYAWGCMLWSPAFTEHLRESVDAGGVADFAGILNNAIASGLLVRGLPLPDGQYSDLGTYEEIAELEHRHHEPPSYEQAEPAGLPRP